MKPKSRILLQICYGLILSVGLLIQWAYTMRENQRKDSAAQEQQAKRIAGYVNAVIKSRSPTFSAPTQGCLKFAIKLDRVKTPRVGKICVLDAGGWSCEK